MCWLLAALLAALPLLRRRRLHVLRRLVLRRLRIPFATYFFTDAG